VQYLAHSASFRSDDEIAPSKSGVKHLVGVDPKTVRRERPPDHAEICKKMHEIAGNRRRFGYWQIGIRLEREGFTTSRKKLHHLCKEEGLSVRRRRGRKNARGTRTPMQIAIRPNLRGLLDFVLYTFGASRKF
jgi:putative transposase